MNALVSNIVHTIKYLLSNEEDGFANCCNKPPKGWES